MNADTAQKRRGSAEIARGTGRVRIRPSRLHGTTVVEPCAPRKSPLNGGIPWGTRLFHAEAGGRSGGRRGIHGTSPRGRQRAISRGTQESWSPGVPAEHLWFQKWLGKPSTEFGWTCLPTRVSLACDGSSRSWRQPDYLWRGSDFEREGMPETPFSPSPSLQSLRLGHDPNPSGAGRTEPRTLTDKAGEARLPCDLQIEHEARQFPSLSWPHFV